MQETRTPEGVVHMLTISSFWFSFQIHQKTYSVHRNTLTHCANAHTRTHTQQHSWADTAVHSSQFVLEVSSEERANRDCLHGWACTTDKIHCSWYVSLMKQTCFKLGQALQKALTGKKNGLLYILTWRWGPCCCTIHVSKLSLGLLY